MSKVYDYVLEAIIAKLEEGIIPWLQPYAIEPSVNYVTGKEYRGINKLLLSGGEYITMKQINNLGGKLKKDSKSRMIVFYNVREKENKDGEIEKIFVLVYHKVFSLNDVEGIPTKLELKQHNIIDEAEELVNGYDVEIRNHPRAFYDHNNDTVYIPQIGKFENAELYYSELFHQLIHSTGHKDRLNRKTIDSDGTYTKEELIAEIGAGMLSASVGIQNFTIDNQAAYIQGWIRTLKEDKRLIVHAAGAAQKATDFILKGGQIESEIEFEVLEV